MNCVAFWTLESFAVQLIVRWCSDLLSGQIIPLLFFPGILQKIVLALPFAAIYSTPLLIYIGKISYGIYLYHEIVRIFVWWATGPFFGGYPRMLAYGIRLTLYLTLSVAVAGASFRFVERPFLELKKRFRSREESVTTTSPSPSP